MARRQIAELGSMLFNYTGFIQGNAPPVSVAGEKLEGRAKQAAVAPPPELGALAQQLAEQSQAVEGAIRRLPKGLLGGEAGDAEEVAALARLHEENESLGRELVEKVSRAEEQIQRLQGLYAVLADDGLAQEGSQEPRVKAE